MTRFQIILLTIFSVFIVVAVMVFAFYRSSSNISVTVTVWGDLTREDFNNLLNATNTIRDTSISYVYVEKPISTLDDEYTEALAQGTGPDLLITTQDRLFELKSKLLAVPYANVTERDFKEIFIEEGELFLDADGIYGFPLSVDPMVLYYNRDLLSAEGMSQPITKWSEVYPATTKLTKRDAAGNLTQSTVALGETQNIKHAKEILTLLFFQAGMPILLSENGYTRPVLLENFNKQTSPTESALNFYTQFSNPTKPYYSWNRTLKEAQTQFTSGDLAYYIGFASEYKTIRSKSPTLNFGVATIPQSDTSGATITYGRLRAVSIARGTKNPTGSLAAAKQLISQPVLAALSQVLYLPPTRRDLLAGKPTDAVMPIFYEAALQSRGWLDPGSADTRAIFVELIESITSGRARINDAMSLADRKLDNLIRK